MFEVEIEIGGPVFVWLGPSSSTIAPGCAEMDLTGLVTNVPSHCYTNVMHVCARTCHRYTNSMHVCVCTCV